MKIMQNLHALIVVVAAIYIYIYNVIMLYIYGDSLKHLAGVLRASFKTLEQAAMESQYI